MVCENKMCFCRPQKASTSSALDIYCTRWRTAVHQTPSLSISTPLSPTQLSVRIHTETHADPVLCRVYYSYCVLLIYCVCVCVFSVSVLQSILSTDACKSGIPKVSELIQTPWVLLFLTSALTHFITCINVCTHRHTYNVNLPWKNNFLWNDLKLTKLIKDWGTIVFVHAIIICFII